MKTGFIFPGQGSQSVGMLSELAETNPIIEKTYAEASEALGYDLWNLVKNGPESDLNSTDRTQPALLAAGVSVWRVLSTELTQKPSVLAGHSLGEYTALVCAGALDFQDGVSLVADRGRFMQDAVPVGEGAMAAILGLDDVVVADICSSTSDQNDGLVSCANFNSPGQIVIAGTASTVNKAIEALKEAGAKRAVLLPVSVPSHCPLMLPAAEALKDRLDSITIKALEIPVVHNVDADMRSKPEDIKQALIDQLHKPVRWVDVIKAVSQGSDQIIECGPGKVLSGLTKRIDRQLICHPVFDSASLEKAIS
ncbi:MAG: ACP S-malonyltransferase [Gammaproteobacteria bacterium]